MLIEDVDISYRGAAKHALRPMSQRDDSRQQDIYQ